MCLMKKQFIVYRCTKLWKDLSFDTNYNFLVFRCTRSKFSKVLLRYHTFCIFTRISTNGHSRICRETGNIGHTRHMAKTNKAKHYNTTENYQDCCHRAHPGAYPGVSPWYTVPAPYTANHDLLVCPNR